MPSSAREWGFSSFSRVPRNADLSLGDVVHAADQVEERGLPGAVRPDDRVDFALGDVDGNIVESAKPVKIFYDITYLEDHLCRHVFLP